MLRAVGMAAKRITPLRWIFLVPMATLLLPATLFVVRQPDIYEARGVVRIREFVRNRRSELPEERMARARAILETTHDRLFSPDNMLVVARGLAPDPDDLQAVDEASTRLRGIFSFERKGDYSFVVRAKDPEPSRALLAVTTLLDTFQAAERDRLREVAQSKQDFWTAPVSEAEAAHAEVLAELNAFKIEREASLPHHREGLNREFIGLRIEIGNGQRHMDVARQEIERLQNSIVGGSETGLPVVGIGSGEVRRLEGWLHELESELRTKEQNLSDLQVQLTDRHPAVDAVLRRIESLNKQIKETEERLSGLRDAGTERDSDDQTPPVSQPGDKLTLFLLERLKTARATYDRERKNVQELEDERDHIAERLRRIPETEERLKALNAGVDEAYETLASRRREMKEAENEVRLHREMNATPYAMAMAPQLPKKPIGPNRARTLFAALGAGMVLGYGVYLLRRRLHKPPIQGPEDVMLLIQGTMIVSVPVLNRDISQRRGLQLSRQDLIAGGWVLCCVLLSALVLAGHKGLIGLPVWVTGLIGTCV